jgi:hypothetical protein
VGETKGGFVDVAARIMAGLTTGAMAVMVAQPTDIVKVYHRHFKKISNFPFDENSLNRMKLFNPIRKSYK